MERSITTERPRRSTPRYFEWPAVGRPNRIVWNKENPDEWTCVNPEGKLARRVFLQFGGTRLIRR